MESPRGLGECARHGAAGRDFRLAICTWKSFTTEDTEDMEVVKMLAGQDQKLRAEPALSETASRRECPRHSARATRTRTCCDRCCLRRRGRSRSGSRGFPGWEK